MKQHPNYSYTAEHDSKRNAFHLERLTSRRLRLKPEEEYTVYEVDTSDEDAAKREECKPSEFKALQANWNSYDRNTPADSRNHPRKPGCKAAKYKP